MVVVYSIRTFFVSIISGEVHAAADLRSRVEWYEGRVGMGL
jgi:hypothetical protein